jgi:hypothetical protein
MPALNDSETTEVDSLVIAQVLGRAHQTAEAHNEPNEARTILDVAHSFADQLSSTDNRFDREGFIEAATEEES